MTSPEDPSAQISQRLPIDRVLAPLQTFASHKLAGAGLLLAATVLAVAWANSRFAPTYHDILHTEVTVGMGSLVVTKTVHHAINDGLMGIFFFLVGLEIKREVLVGELSSARKAALPAIAALGGMALPALLYWAVVGAGPASEGWGIPMATDIAFALGVLAVVGDRVPLGLRVLLTALAIVDDIGAVLVIAIFYTDHVSLLTLALGLAGVGVSAGMNRLGVRNSLVYLPVGLVTWLCFLDSGVHATIAALLMAFTIPARTRIDGRKLVSRLEQTLGQLRNIDRPGGLGLNAPAQQRALDNLARIRSAAAAPLQDLEHSIVGLVTFIVLPIFALANAGVDLSGFSPASLGDGVALGVMVGLVLGKPLGIVGFSWLGTRMGLADLPTGVRWPHILGVGLLAGIGFTMALFIAGLAFPDPSLLESAKLAILAASLVSGVAGLAVLRALATDSLEEE